MDGVARRYWKLHESAVVFEVTVFAPGEEPSSPAQESNQGMTTSEEDRTLVSPLWN